jgi:translation initiation factor IF-2
LNFINMATENTTQLNSNATVLARPPIVVVLGHVDHGKSSLLEAIRDEFKITAQESGGITQHIGAYVVEYQDKSITFLDTPGHEAFSAMRSRGATVADIAVLVVAADEGVKPQTKEAIEQAKKAGLPMIVVLNKIDKPEAEPERVKQELAQHDVYLESFGGDVPFALVSAKNKQGIAELLEMILLVAEVEGLTASQEKPAHGVVIESFLDSQRGPTATLLVRDGVLSKGDIVGTKTSFGKARIIEDFTGKTIEQAFPATPVVIAGLEQAFQVGEEFSVFVTEEEARKHISHRPVPSRVSQVLEPGTSTLDIILKTDVLGSLEALEQMFLSLPQEKVVLRLVDAGVGEIGESDVKTAQGTNAIIVGFRTKINPGAASLAEREGVRIATFDIIYELVQKVRSFMEKSLEPEVVRKDLGTLRVVQVFLTDKKRQIVGGRVLEGEVRKGVNIEVHRDGQVVDNGKVTSVQKGKQEVGMATKGDECGVLYQGKEQIQQGDTLYFFTHETQKPTL